ncbi:MAG: ATP-binding protein [Alphaproteobacteria bacterium]|nr:MAG: ATP-binding protein [Alphaproteobacteria bacterium]
MLVGFRVENFRSLKAEQVFSLVASKDKTLEETHTVSTGLKAAPRLLRSAVIYGANGSGKSNLIKAIQCMQQIIVHSARRPSSYQTFRVQPFRIDAETVSAPTRFEMTFIIDSVRYQYSFSLNADRILSEDLLVYKTSKPQLWYDRRYDSITKKYSYHFGSGLKGRRHVWEEVTRPDALLLSTAVQLNSEALSPIYNWFANNLVIINEYQPLNIQYTLAQLEARERYKDILDFLASADISVSDIELKKKKTKGTTITVDTTSRTADNNEDEMEVAEILLLHEADTHKLHLALQDESTGTRNLLFLSGPLLSIIDLAQTLLIDEMGSSLHPLLLQEIVRLFHHRRSSAPCAQLIFTTHDTSLLGTPNLFRRDQIWLVEKHRSQASDLVSLSEFSPRKGEALERGYLTGRYGGIPFLRHQLRSND